VKTILFTPATAYKTKLLGPGLLGSLMPILHVQTDQWNIPSLPLFFGGTVVREGRNRLQDVLAELEGLDVTDGALFRRKFYDGDFSGKYADGYVLQNAFGKAVFYGKGGHDFGFLKVIELDLGKVSGTSVPLVGVLGAIAEARELGTLVVKPVLDFQTKEP
jgi:hypothetical protein